MAFDLEKFASDNRNKQSDDIQQKAELDRQLDGQAVQAEFRTTLASADRAQP